MPRGLRGKLFRCNALPHRVQPAARISSAIFSSVRTRNSTNLESSRVVWHIRGVSLVLGTQERQVYPRGSQDSRGRPPSLPQPIRWGPRKSPFRKVLRNIGPEPVRKSEEIFLVDRVQHRGGRSLDDFVFQSTHRNRPLPAIGLWYVLPTTGQRPVRSPVDPRVQI